MNPDLREHPDPLAALLQQADAAAPLPPVHDGLAATVRQVSRRRHQRRRLVATGGALVLAVASVVAVVRAPEGRSGNHLTAGTMPLPAPVETIEDYRRAKSEADALARSANRFLAAERHRQRLEELNARSEDAIPSQADRIESLRATAALTLITQADRLRTRAASPSDALATYRRAADLFPDTPWVAVARQRIEQLQSRSNNQETPL